MVEHIFNRLYSDYHQSLFQFLIYLVRDRDIAEDLTQDVYIKVLNSYEGFKGDSSEKTWLFSIARNVAIDYIRKQKRRRKTISGIFDIKEKENQLVHPDKLPDEIIDESESVKHLYGALSKCKEEHQQVILLRFIHSFSIKETASVMGWTEGRVKTVQHRTLKALKNILEDSRKEDELSNGTI